MTMIMLVSLFLVLVIYASVLTGTVLLTLLDQDSEG